MTTERDAEPGASSPTNETLSFAGHEGFALRYGWLKKCVDAVESASEFFAREDAVVRLGVGKNMVRAVRHWGLVARVIEEVVGTRGRALRVTALGRQIFGEGGSDPYLEDPRTLWLLHWLICTHPERATTWRWAFGVWGRAAFTRDELRAALRGVARTGRATDTTLARDVDVFLRTYLPARASRAAPLEDTLDSPLVELGLLRTDPVEGRFELVRGPRPSLDDGTLGFAVLDFWERAAPHSETLHVDDLAHGPGAPGRVFGLDDRSLHERLEYAEAWSRGHLLYDQTAGLRQLRRARRVDALAWLERARARGAEGTT